MRHNKDESIYPELKIIKYYNMYNTDLHKKHVLQCFVKTSETVHCINLY